MTRLPLVVARVVLLLLAAAAPVSAGQVEEQPWHPVPAAYLRGLFYVNLKPIDWRLVADEFEHPLAASGFEGRTVLDLLAAADGPQSDHRAAVRQAIAGQDRAALYTSTTGAIAALVRRHLATAQSVLDSAAAARAELHRAQAVFRAFQQDAVRLADPRGLQALEQAWLNLNRAAGSAAPAEAERFARARRVIEGYLSANYEGLPEPVGGRLLPLPGSADADPRRADEAARMLAAMLPPGSDLGNQDPLPLLRLNAEARGIKERELFLASYGHMLFDSPQIFGEPARSLGLACSTCHNRGDVNRRFFIPGISHRPGAVDVDGDFFNPRFNDYRSDSVDIPSLRGIRFTAPYGRDGRISSLREFTRNVIVNEFGGPEPSPLMLDALVHFMFELDWLPAPYLEPDGRLKPTAPQAALRGQRLFNKRFSGLGDRACSTCHIPSSGFLDGRRHDIESGNPSGPASRDSLFDTPTLINALYTAPYMHDGALHSLSAVVDWFDEQHALGLSAEEAADLTAYLEAVGTADAPWERFDDRRTPYDLRWKELSSFMATLETLIADRDRRHAELLLTTVAQDSVLDAGAAVDPQRVPLLREIAKTLDGIRQALAQPAWDRATSLARDLQVLTARYRAALSPR